MSNFSLKSEPAHPARAQVAALDTLQKDMLEALHDDQVKKQINDAKLRAVKQRVEYDEFEKLVAGAHLKPIKPKSDTLADIGKQFDGFVLPKHETAAVQGPKAPPKAAVVSTEEVPPAPKTSNEFARVWKRQCKTPATRVGYVRHLDPDTLPLIFRTELDPTLFDGIVATLGEACLDGVSSASAPSGGDVDLSELDGVPAADGASKRADDLLWAARLLEGIVRLNRFDITLDFADKKTSEKLTELFAAMSSGGVEAERVDELRKAYKA